MEKYKHQAAAIEERVEGLLLDKTKAEKAVSDLEKEKTSRTKDKGNFEKKIGELEGDLVKAKDEAENGKIVLVSQSDGGFERVKSQVAFLFPELDLSALDSLKIVQDGKLIDEP